MSLDINKLKEYLDSEEGKAHMSEYVAAEIKREGFREYRMNRFHEVVKSDSNFFGRFVEATLKKEASDKYRDRYRKKREEPTLEEKKEKIRNQVREFINRTGKLPVNSDYLSWNGLPSLTLCK